MLSHAPRLQLDLAQGTIPSELFASLGYIFEIDISDNILTGTLPGDIGQGDAYLRSLDFHANPLGGAMPDSVAKMLAQTGTSLNARGTFLSCCGLGYNSTAAAEQIQFLRIQAKRTTPSEPSSSVSVSSAKVSVKGSYGRGVPHERRSSGTPRTQFILFTASLLCPNKGFAMEPGFHSSIHDCIPLF
eukprot:77274-Chlamydomonas_euryale.AAC.4